MEDCARNSKRSEEIAAVGSPAISFPKKMKIQIDFTSIDELNLDLPSQQLLQDHLLSALSPDKKISPATSPNSGGFLPGDICSGNSIACRSFSIESSLLPKDSLRVVDLEAAKSFETDSSTCIDNKFSRETTPSSDSDEMDSMAGKKSSGGGQKLQAEVEEKKKMTKEEIEAFFAEAEKELRERFTDKYNYDIVNDVPLEGRYEWVRLKP